MTSVARFVGVLRAEVARVAALAARLDDADWDRPTRCPPMNVRELVAHILRGPIRINAMVDAGPLDQQPEGDALTYWRSAGAVPDAAHPIASDVVERAQADASGRTPADLLEALRHDYEAALARVEALAKDDPVLDSPFARLRLSEYLRTRFVEVVVHHMDLRDALGMDPDPDPEALAVVTGVLSGMLGTDAIALGFDPVRFALVGTGRERLDDAEQKMLGPLANEIPLIV